MRELSLLEFATLLPKLAADMVIAKANAMELAAQIVEREAKDACGEYQPNSGPFQAWAELADSTKADRFNQGFPENEPELRTGRMRDTIQHTVNLAVGEHIEAEIGSDDQILEWQELGTSKMPPRSILGGAAARKEKEVIEVLASEVVATLIGREIHNGRLAIIN